MESSLLRATPASAWRHKLCSACLHSWYNTRLKVASQKLGLQCSDRIGVRSKGHIAAAGDQAKPLEGFYADLISQPLRKVQPATSTMPTPPPPDQLPKTEKEETLQKARVVFGSRLAGPAEHQAKIEEGSKNVAGVMVPPKPTEPDNCCMSGCVNCVWDIYRDDMEDWAAKSAEARAALQARRASGSGTDSMVVGEGTPSHVATSMDDDGGGSESSWSSALESGQDSLFDDIPVGIREFMRTEKMLKQKHMQETSAGG